MEQWKQLLGQINRLAKLTGVKPDKNLLDLSGHFLHKMAFRLGFLVLFLSQVNDQLETARKTQDDENPKAEAKSKPAKKSTKTTKGE